MSSHKRLRTCIGIGSLLALIGIVLVIWAPEITDPRPIQVPYEVWFVAQARCAGLGVAILLGGFLISAVGLSEWCRSGVHHE